MPPRREPDIFAQTMQLRGAGKWNKATGEGLERDNRLTVKRVSATALPAGVE
jgi:hypothetical protein